MYDYIIVGAGSAGCVIADRLSADSTKRVLLLEAGPADRNIFLKIPAGLSRVFVHPRLNWGYFSEPETHLGNRRIYWPRGKTLGGSSAINGMIYIRGQPEDFEAWARLGNAGWGWNDVLPLFKRVECNERGANEWHGDAGELYVSDVRFAHPTSQAFIDAAVEAGIPPTSDFNGVGQLGAGYYQFTIRNGVRDSSAAAFLRPARRRPNLEIRTGALAERILFENRQARGLVYRLHGKLETALAREVIVCAGAVNSPQLLLLSGVGPAADLRAHGIDIVADSPGVGGNLQDHLYIHHLCETHPRFSINRSMGGWRLLPELANYLARRRGLLTIGASQAAAFVKSNHRVATPDLQIMFKPYTLQMSPGGAVRPAARPGVTTAVCLLRPASRGALRLRSADAGDPPAIYPNYLSAAEDGVAMTSGLRLIRRIFAAPSLSGLAKETAPGYDFESDEALLGFIREQSQSMFHPVGTCKMGSDAEAVVDSRLRVRGVSGLWVADASIMPTIVSGNTNAASIMIGEKAAELILADARGN